MTNAKTIKAIHSNVRPTSVNPSSDGMTPSKASDPENSVGDDSETHRSETAPRKGAVDRKIHLLAIELIEQSNLEFLDFLSRQIKGALHVVNEKRIQRRYWMGVIGGSLFGTGLAGFINELISLDHPVRMTIHVLLMVVGLLLMIAKR